MRSFDINNLNFLTERERQELAALDMLEKRRQSLMVRLRNALGKGVEANVTAIAERTQEPAKTQLLALSGSVRLVVEKLDRVNRINSRVSQAVVTSIARVLKVVTGMAQHAGLYMANGRKAAIKGIHLLDAVG